MIETEIHGQRLICADTFEGMATLPDGSVDMILCDLPYGTTANDWDTCIDHERMWVDYWRVAKPNAAIVLTSQQPFATRLIMGAMKEFRYEWIWEKLNAVGFLNVKKTPLRAHENVLVFYRELPTYNPQKTYGHKPYVEKSHRGINNYGKKERTVTVNTDGSRFPRSVLRFDRDEPYVIGKNSKGENVTHGTQKPVPLFANLIRTYTNQGETVLDNTAGIMTTAVAAKLTGRRSICIERESLYYEGGIRRLDPQQKSLDLEGI